MVLGWKGHRKGENPSPPSLTPFPLLPSSPAGGQLDSHELLRLSRERTAAVLRQRKQLKRRLALASQRFNTDAKHWIEYAQVGQQRLSHSALLSFRSSPSFLVPLQELALLPTPADAPSVARFLRDCPGLDRTLIGAYISEPDDAKHAFQTCVDSFTMSLL